MARDLNELLEMWRWRASRLDREGKPVQACLVEDLIDDLVSTMYVMEAGLKQ